MVSSDKRGVEVILSRMKSAVAVLVAILLVLTSCGGVSHSGESGSGQKEDETLTVLAASSLTDAFGELSETFEKENPGVNVKASYESSSTLLAQIQQGAPADVFASADEVKMRTATDEGLVAGEPRVFVKNREVILVPKENPAGIEEFRDIAKPGVKLVLAEDGVPVAEYAKEILGKADEEYGGGFEKAVMSNIVSREADVRASVNRVALGEADATFGYESDYTPEVRDKVQKVEIPENLNIIAAYPIAALEDSEVPGLAQKWLDLVTSEKGQRVLDKQGFEPAS